MKYYNGAYYLIKLRKPDYGSIKDSTLYTCSTCINDSYLDSWSISWAKNDEKSLSETKSIFGLTENKIHEIQNWTDKKFENEKIGWINTFSDLETLLEYKNTFFQNEIDFQILSINFPEEEKIEFLQTFKKESDIGEIGLSLNLKKSTLESIPETEIGYDLIGVEIGGDFHSFHCHDLAEDLINRFNVKLNEFGLIETSENWRELVEYMNDEANGFEPVPWFFVKVKKVNNPASS